MLTGGKRHEGFLYLEGGDPIEGRGDRGEVHQVMRIFHVVTTMVAIRFIAV